MYGIILLTTGLEKIMIFLNKKIGFFDLNQIFLNFFLYKQVIQGDDGVQMLYDDVINDKVDVGFKRVTEDRELRKYNRRCKPWIDLLHAWYRRRP